MIHETSGKDLANRCPGTVWGRSARRLATKGLLKLSFWLRGGTLYTCKCYHPMLSDAPTRKRAGRSDISDHLGVLFYFATIAAPRLIVELGTRGGESTRALLAAASETNSILLSIDIEDCSQIDIPVRDRWHFVRSDDVEFGVAAFRSWCDTRSIAPEVDVLFIDTSHTYEHTKAEIGVWSNHLSENGIIIFHDTNMGSGVFARMDGTISCGWDNDRGVMAAIEETVGRRYDEKCFFSDVTDKYAVLHFPNCNGLTIVKRRVSR